jgi:L,D-transpeptidase catalytic domain
MRTSDSSNLVRCVQRRRDWLRLLVTLLLLLGATVPASAQSTGNGEEPALQALETPEWSVTLAPATLYSQPDENGDSFAILRPSAPLEILGYAGDWAYVFNPRTKGTAYVLSDILGPAGQPSSYAEIDPPPVEVELERTGEVRDDTPVSFYPTDDPAAVYTQLDAGTSVEITGSLNGDDGQEWYRTAEGDFLPAAAVAFPSPPSAPVVNVTASTRARYFAYGVHWIDVDLNLPATMTAYSGSTAVRLMYPVIGRGSLSTPVGDFSIIRRVVNETMDSSTIGIPRNGPGGYYLTGVLFTQYFTSGGASIHYNYWSSNWGYPGSHGCLGLPYDDAAYMWDFADYGTLISIHY